MFPSELNSENYIYLLNCALSTIGNESKWFEIIDRFKDIISKDDQLTQPQKKDVLRSIIDHIKVSFDGINKTHQLDVNFRIPMVFVEQSLGSKPKTLRQTYSTVTDFAKFLGWSTLQPLMIAMWYDNNCNGIVANKGTKASSVSGISIT